jgi:hypothetical protein
MNFELGYSKPPKPTGKKPGVNGKFKTEMCRNWALGLCQFGDSCAFAHGTEEMRCKNKFSNYKTKDCKQFHELGYCKYGSRCQFKHRDTSVDTASSSGEENKPTLLENFEVYKRRLPVFAKLAPN